MRTAALKSSLLESAAYQDPLALLELRFAGGAAYRYFRVPAPIYEELLRAESKGAYFNYHIRNRFACVKLPVAGPTGDS